MKTTKTMVLAALCVALGIVLPMAFHSVPNAGSIFLPMHIPVLLCGLICGPIWGVLCGAATPLLSSLITGMPPMAYLPGMLCELAVYGLCSGLLMMVLKKANPIVQVYASLLGAMVAGRFVAGVLNALIFRAGAYSMQIWLTASFATALPGIIIQIVAIPLLLAGLYKANLVRRVS